MNKTILNAWDNNNHKLKEYFRGTMQEEYNSYLGLLKKTIEIIFPEEVDEYREFRLDPERITEINHGEYQGTLVFVIADDSYQPNADGHWYTSINYGSCSGCDTLEAIRNYSDELPNEDQVEAYWTLCLHMMQKIKQMEY